MYLAELTLWLGWALLYGSPLVFLGFLIMCVLVSVLAPREEQSLEANFGEAYREYKARVPRWLSRNWGRAAHRGGREGRRRAGGVTTRPAV
jgi:protein-S-isoprenylcysteine O-methyltransferase Ste14